MEASKPKIKKRIERKRDSRKKNLFLPKKLLAFCNRPVIIFLIAGTKVGRTGGLGPAKRGWTAGNSVSTSSAEGGEEAIR